ncbi:hypothetical protein BBK36DRAFT_1200759 [Trichoderma citrinoviride]|uniref:Pre-rRNA-processing protein RIX1 n=1 Tax=Trichoderma citrinoviride TaxID=58853 RepID=A0A2T4BAH6_9HYPO|nr:hypothetical protein BBK36DRAFT_1200759 [Trichoderma citrinoviride]PTB66330.1 hypothetical protein BBK36DRAFT_1200759 [Trichoderma citrinoviride]
MSSSASTTDLRVLTRKLTSVPPAQLPHALPSLIRHVLRCRDALSAPQDPKLKGDASQTSMLVHKLKTSITTHLNGRSREGRFAAIGLIKAAVDVGGWETLRGSEAWVRGLLSIIQKGDPAASKELAVVTLTKIFMLVHPYQTLVREVATPFLPAFGTACLQLIKHKAEAQTSAPLTLVETICSSFSTLIPLYPPTFRPFSSQIRTAVGVYLAPTCSDEISVPVSLQRAARRLVASLHFVAAKSSGGEEWAKLVDGIIQEFHTTADQVLRAVDESWEATSGRSRSQVDVDGEPHGQGSSVDNLPAWSGLEAGAERLIGLFHFLADLLSYPTKAAVTIPISGLVDTVSRVCLIARLSKSQTWEQAVETNSAIGREEKEELWSLMPDIHVAAMKLVIALFERLQRHMLPLVPEILDHLIRVFKSGISIPSVRVAGYTTLNTILQLAGPTLSKPAVDMLDPLVGACCRDLQQDAGFLKPADKPTTTTTATPSQKGPKNGAATVNTDLFLQPTAAAAATEPPTLEPHHRNAASALLAAILAQLPQSHLKPALRGHLDKTAILTRSRDAMLASVLNPYRDQHGRMYPSILPHLVQQFPHDQGLEILRSNLRTSGVQGAGSEMFASLSEVAELQQIDEEEEEEAEQEEGKEEKKSDEEMQDPSSEKEAAAAAASPSNTKIDLPVQSTVTAPNPFEPRASKSTGRAASPPKRKHEGPDVPVNPKRQELEKTEPAAASASVTALQTKGGEKESGQQEESDSDDDEGSVHLNMELDDDEEEEDEEEEE